MKSIAQGAKAIFAFLAAGLGSLQVALLGEGTSLDDLSDGQWVGILSTALVAGGGVYGIRNRAPGDLGEKGSP